MCARRSRQSGRHLHVLPGPSAPFFNIADLLYTQLKVGTEEGSMRVHFRVSEVSRL